MQSSRKKFWYYAIIAAAISLSILGIYHVNHHLDIAVEPEGAVILNADSCQVQMRAIRPEVKVVLDRTGNMAVPVELIIDNISAEQTVVVSAENQQVASLQTAVLSPKKLKLTISGGQGQQQITLYPAVNAAAEDGFKFAIIGDSQGRNETLAVIIEEINQQKPDFVVHLGDMVPSGGEEEYANFMNTMFMLQVPFYTVPGNHDVKNEGREYYTKYFGPDYQHFEFKGCEFVLLDSSTMTMEDEEMEWLNAALTGDKPALVFLHVPPYDPLGKDHGFLDVDKADSFVKTVSADNSPVIGVFSGHVHMFNKQEKNTIPFIVSGGAGAPLYAAPDEGGYHHYAIATVNNGGIDTAVYPVEPPQRDSSIIISSSRGDIEVSGQELASLDQIAMDGSFQNAFENFVAQGLYTGVPVRTLIEKYAGGMNENEALAVYSIDGYCQVFARENVYPETAGWEAMQGEMVLAAEYNGTGVEEWDEAYRIVFLPEDGIYDNEDCANTSAPGQGWNLYESAGARWVKNTVRLEVIPWN